MGLRDLLGKRSRAAAPPDIPPDATFRRAVGLAFNLSPCDGLDNVRVEASRQHGTTRTSLTLDQASVLFRASTWSSARELGVPIESLASLVAQDMLFWSPGRPAQDLTGGPAERLDAPLALRRNAWVTPIFGFPSGQAPASFMPRLSTMDRATLAGIQFQVVELDKITHAVTFSCCSRHSARLGEWMAALDGSRDCTSLVQSTEDARLLDALNRMGLLENRPAAESWTGEPRVTWLGHAAVLVEMCGARVLIDPLFHPRSIPARAGADTAPDPGLGPVDAVFITHGDHDHFNPHALLRLRRDTPIYYPRATHPQPFHVDMRRMLEILGFSRASALDPGQHVRIGADVTVEAVPFAGEDWGLSLPQLTYLVTGPPLTVFLSADCHRMDDVFRDVARRHTVDVAFLGVTGMAETFSMPPGFGCGEFYAPWMDPRRANEWTQLTAGPGDAADAAALLGARFAFGYAAAGASFIPLAYTDRGTHAELAAILEQRPGGPRPLAFPLGVPVVVPPPTDG